jgi:hypothetical protein
VRWIARPRPVLQKHVSVKDDGRALISYTWREDTAR